MGIASSIAWLFVSSIGLSSPYKVAAPGMESWQPHGIYSEELEVISDWVLFEPFSNMLVGRSVGLLKKKVSIYLLLIIYF